MRKLHKAFLRWHDPENWPILREGLMRMGRADLIGPGKHHLIPAWQPLGTGDAHEGRRSRQHAQQPIPAKAPTHEQRRSAPQAAAAPN
ncbi:MAG: DUF3362 domain-containing protein, partial [Gammaproteobacteria bacterium]